jgi:hypothetical protein
LPDFLILNDGEVEAKYSTSNEDQNKIKKTVPMFYRWRQETREPSSEDAFLPPKSPESKPGQIKIDGI